MNIQTKIVTLERNGAAAGMTKPELCRRAGLSVSTFNRWLSGASMPLVCNLASIERVIDEANDTIDKAVNGRGE